MTTRPLGVTVVLSPALGGIVIGHEVARALGVRAIFAERQGGGLQLRRGFALDTSDRVLVVEDVVTTGGSTRETLDVARAAGATPVGAAALVDRSGATADLGVPFSALLRITLPTYVADDCPLCAQGLPVVKPGSRVRCHGNAHAKCQVASCSHLALRTLHLALQCVS